MSLIRGFDNIKGEFCHFTCATTYCTRKVKVLSNTQKTFKTSLSYHEEKRGHHGTEELRSIGGDRVDSVTPGQRVEPQLADHIQVGGDVHCSVVTAHK